MTVGQLREFLKDQEDDVPVYIYLDVYENAYQPFDFTQSRVNVCGYFSAECVKAEDHVAVLTVKDPIKR